MLLVAHRSVQSVPLGGGGYFLIAYSFKSCVKLKYSLCTGCYLSISLNENTYAEGIPFLRTICELVSAWMGALLADKLA